MTASRFARAATLLLCVAVARADFERDDVKGQYDLVVGGGTCPKRIDLTRDEKQIEAAHILLDGVQCSGGGISLSSSPDGSAVADAFDDEKDADDILGGDVKGVLTCGARSVPEGSIFNFVKPDEGFALNWGLVFGSTSSGLQESGGSTFTFRRNVEYLVLDDACLFQKAKVPSAVTAPIPVASGGTTQTKPGTTAKPQTGGSTTAGTAAAGTTNADTTTGGTTTDSTTTDGTTTNGTSNDGTTSAGSTNVGAITPGGTTAGSATGDEGDEGTAQALPLETTLPVDGNQTLPQETALADLEAQESASPEDGSEDDEADTGSVCFPGSATVQMESGKSRRMDKLAIGDRVLVGNGVYSDVFAWTHKDAAYTSTGYVRIITASGLTLTATPTHYVYANGRSVPAGTVRAGDTMTRADGSAAAVSSVERVAERGLFNPQTVHGDIVVNGLMSTTYTTAIEPSAAHAMLAPLRAAYRAVQMVFSEAGIKT